MNNNNLSNSEAIQILIVEDNMINMLLLKTLLLKKGYEVLTAINGQEALVLLENHNPDVILMDINMPVMNGYEASIAIRHSEDRIKSIPIIAVTAEMHPDTRSKVLQSGMNDYVPKPIDIDELIESIKKFINK
jgi:CheY-like chemotaxis protein